MARARRAFIGDTGGEGGGGVCVRWGEALRFVLALDLSAEVSLSKAVKLSSSELFLQRQDGFNENFPLGHLKGLFTVRSRGGGPTCRRGS